MPWRQTPAPYFTWVSETMLQQTQVDTVIPYFNRFIESFPTVESLAKADRQSVLKQWEGLGYYSRARNLHETAQRIVSEFNGQLPTSYEQLQTLKGIGPYIAAAIASIAFDEPIPVVDGNVLRVFTRFWGLYDDIRAPKTRTLIFDQLAPIIRTVPPNPFNQAIMELGALICKPTTPKCSECPLATDCEANTQGITDQLPVKSSRPKVPHYVIAVGVIRKDDAILIAKRKETQMLGGLWEFPGGKQKPGESLETTVQRETQEETGLKIEVEDQICKVNHAYTHFKITLHAFRCRYKSGIAIPKESEEIRWVTTNELAQYPFPKANKRVIEELLKETCRSQQLLFT